jgi:hypothetical protein
MKEMGFVGRVIESESFRVGDVYFDINTSP